VILPFEEALWRDAGADAQYVGHPALDAPVRSKDVLRAALGLSADRHAVALLPGSRAHEVRRLAPSMLHCDRKRWTKRGARSKLASPSLRGSMRRRARAQT